MTEFNRMQTIKRHMFALRNGIIADTLRKAGTAYKVIFGLNLPQIKEIADTLEPDAVLAEELWADRRTRESLLLAPMVYPLAEMNVATARRWVLEAAVTGETEIVDNLCHKLIRRLDGAMEIARGLLEGETDMEHYAAIRLMWNLVGTHAEEILPLARREADRECTLTRRVAQLLAEEAQELLL